jgi:hypothetical protein
VFCLFSFRKTNKEAMKEERLRKMIKSMYQLRSVLRMKHDDDKVFRDKSKTKVLAEVDEIIDRSLEDFYSLRIN